MSCSPSLTAIPADSWPRCWSANSPRAATVAASVPLPGGTTAPKTPHISARLPAEGSRQTGFPRVPEVRERDLERIGAPAAPLLGGPGCARASQLDDEPIPTDDAELLDRQSVLPGEKDERRDVPWPGSHDQPRWALAKQVDRR